MILIAVARENLEEKGLTLENNIAIESQINAIPDIFCHHIGRLNHETKQFESLFKADVESGTTSEFDKFKDAVKLIERTHTVYPKGHLDGVVVTDYYVPYDVQESSMHRPTVTDCHIEHSSLDGHYECEFELLLTCNEATRRVVLPYRSVNVHMLELLRDLEDDVKDILSGNCDEKNPLKELINVNSGDNYGMMVMFDEIGHTCDVEIDSPRDFVSMIVSVRQIKCEWFD